MADEQVSQANPEVDLTPGEETKEERKKRLNISDLPYHTYETEQIAKQRAIELDVREE